MASPLHKNNNNNLLLLLLLTTTPITPTKAQSTYDYIDSICSPTSPTTGTLDLNFPCNAVIAVQAQCIFGPAGLEYILGTNSSSSSSSPPPQQSNTTQQICICNSQFWPLLSACGTCHSAHGDDTFFGEMKKSSSKGGGDVAERISKEYCDASATPTLGFGDYTYQFAGEFASNDDDNEGMTTTTKIKDPIGNKTDVSLYYTASGGVTGSSAWIVADPTATSGFVRDGQFVAIATATGNGDQKGDAGRKTGVLAAVLGLTGLVALSMI